MELIGVRLEMPSSSPIALLRELDGDRRVLPIFIGAPEATAIAFAVDEVVTPRPMTHDLIKTFVDRLNGSIDRVVIDDFWNTIYYAKLYLRRAEEGT